MKLNATKSWVLLSLLPSAIYAAPAFGVGLGHDFLTAGTIGKTTKTGTQVGKDLTKIAKPAHPTSAKPGGFGALDTPKSKTPQPVDPINPKTAEPTDPIKPKTAEPVEPIKPKFEKAGDPPIKVPPKPAKPKLVEPKGAPESGFTHPFLPKRKPPHPLDWTDDYKALYFTLDTILEDGGQVATVNRYQRKIQEARLKQMEAFRTTLSTEDDEVVTIADRALDAKTSENAAKSGTSIPENSAEKPVTFTPGEVLDLANGANPKTPEAAKLAEVVRPKADSFEVMQPNPTIAKSVSKGGLRILYATTRDLNHFIKTAYLELLNSKLAILAQADFERFHALYTSVSRFFDKKSQQIVAQIARVRNRLPRANSILRAGGADKDGLPQRTLGSFFQTAHP